MSTLSLTKRPATIGGSINTRTERHGEEKVPGLDIPLSGILINGAELALLIDCPTAYDALYLADEALGVVPRFNAFGDFAVLHKFSNATVKIDKTTFSPAKLKSIRLAPQTGGLTEISFTLQVNPEEPIDVPGLLNAKVSITIKAAELEQGHEDDHPELPMDHSQDEIAEAEREERKATEESESGISRQIRQSETKRRRKAEREQRAAD